MLYCKVTPCPVDAARAKKLKNTHPKAGLPDGVCRPAAGRIKKITKAKEGKYDAENLSAQKETKKQSPWLPQKNVNIQRS